MKYLLTSIMIIQLVTGIAGCETGNYPVSIRWRIAGNLPVVNGKQPGVAGASAGVHNNVLLVAGGANFPDSMPWLGGRKKYHDDVYAFNRDTDGNLKSLPTIFKLNQPLAYAASVSTEQGIVCVGGENDNGISADVFIMKWDEKNKRINIVTLPALPYPITNASITTDNRKIYVAGGEIANGVSNGFFYLDLNDTASGWRFLAALPQPVSHAVLTLVLHNSAEQIYIVGGRQKNPGTTSNIYKDVYAFNINENRWNTKTALPYALSAAAGIATENSVLIFGGDRGETFHRTELLIAEIDKATDEREKQKLNERKAALQTAHPGFTKGVLQYFLLTNEWKVSDSIPFEVPVTTTVIRWGDDIIIPSGEIKAGVRTPVILAGKLEDR